MLKFIMMKNKSILEQLNPEIFKGGDEEYKYNIIAMILSAEGIDKFYKENNRKI